MRLRILDMPESGSELRAWLTEQLTSPSLAEVVSELCVVHQVTDPERQPTPSLDDILGEQAGDAVGHGLDALSDQQCQQLLLSPLRLLELQMRIAIEGGQVWQSAAQAHDATRQRAVSTWSDLDFDSHKISNTSSNRRRWLLASLAVAALTAIVSTLQFQLFAPAQASWGWMKQGVPDESLPPPDYLNNIADTGEEWFDERPNDPAALSKRLRELKQGCDLLIAAKHTCLSKADRSWLLDRCRAWSLKLSVELEQLDRQGPVDRVRSSVDEIVKKLSSALRKRASNLEQDA